MTELRVACEEELAVVRVLLQRAGLPTSDLALVNPKFMVLRENGRVVAAGALQPFGSVALVRSVVVAGDRRGIGLGRLMVQELEKVARITRISELILLTESAAEFFARQGYRVIERINAPRDVQRSEEFRSLCPASAICMTKRLSDSE